MIDKILIFTTRHLCYNSGDFFAAQLANGFEENGIECEYCELEFEELYHAVESSSAILTEESQHKLEGYLGKSYLAVIDFNSRMPHMILDDGSYYLDGIDAPFYDYILDHPLYHHSTVSCQLKNFNVILLDQNQCNYVQNHYSWIKNVIFQPLSGQQAISPIFQKEKKQEVLFAGTYRNPDAVYEQILEEKDEALRNCMLGMIDWLSVNPNGTVEQALEMYMHMTSGCDIDLGVVVGNDQVNQRNLRIKDQNHVRILDSPMQEYAKILNLCYPVEIYIRNLYRKNLIDAFAKESIPLRIVGDWWEQYEHFQDSSSITYQPAVPFARSFELINKSAILLDSSPFFQCGIHDRVTAAMANRTIALTDENAYIRGLQVDTDSCLRELQNAHAKKTRCGIQTYPVNHPEAAVTRVEELLANPSMRAELAEQAYDFYEKEFTWKKVAEKLLITFQNSVKNGH